MSEIVWMKPYLAAIQLASHWNIHLQTAEQIVWGVMQPGRARTVRGRRQFERGLRDIGEEIGAVMRRRAIHLKGNGLYSPDFTDVEINWDHLSKMAASYSTRSSAAILG
jgi:hypothetical protein